MKVFLSIFCFIVFALPRQVCAQQHIYEVSHGVIYFHSDATNELIKASSDRLIGIVDVSKRTFFLKINIASFVGFNNPRQKEHFNENYMESDVFPTATYAGKIIEDVDFTRPGTYNVRTKGKLTIHGVEHECIIKCKITCGKESIKAEADFVVLLADYNIKIPRIVYDKLSPEINVSVTAVLQPKASP